MEPLGSEPEDVPPPRPPPPPTPLTLPLTPLPLPTMNCERTQITIGIWPLSVGKRAILGEPCHPE